MARHARVVRSAAGVDVDQDVSGRGSTLLTAKLALRQRGVSVATRPPSHPMLAVALVVHGLVTPAIVTTARPLANVAAPRVAAVRTVALAPPVHRSRCRSVRLQAEEDDDDASDGDSEGPRRSAVLFRRVSDVLFLLTTIAIQAIGAASVIGGPARWNARPVGPASQSISAHWPRRAEAGGRPKLGPALARVAGARVGRSLWGPCPGPRGWGRCLPT